VKGFHFNELKKERYFCPLFSREKNPVDFRRFVRCIQAGTRVPEPSQPLWIWLFCPENQQNTPEK
jgi:hypothetical protein